MGIAETRPRVVYMTMLLLIFLSIDSWSGDHLRLSPQVVVVVLAARRCQPTADMHRSATTTAMSLQPQEKHHHHHHHQHPQHQHQQQEQQQHMRNSNDMNVGRSTRRSCHNQGGIENSDRVVPTGPDPLHNRDDQT